MTYVFSGTLNPTQSINHRTTPSATDSISFVTFSLQQYQPGIEWVQALADISRLALLP